MKNPASGDEFNIITDYGFWSPHGIHRTYFLEITEDTQNITLRNRDGLDLKEARYVKLSYPGPWLHACWDDVNSSVHLERLL